MAELAKPQPSPGEIAERVQRRRTRIIWVQAIFFFLWQTTFFANMPNFDAPLRRVDQAKLSAFALWAVALMFLLAVGGGMLRGKAVRALINDELTREHRRSAWAWGYFAAMISAIALYVASQYVRISAAEALHLVVSAGVFIPMVRFVVLERRAEKQA